MSTTTNTQKQPGKPGAARALPGRPPTLHKDDVVRAALAILDEEGHGALSMRAIARRLGTGPATLYNYFESLQDVEDAIVSELLSTIHPPDPGSGVPVREQLVNAVMAHYDVFLRHPNLEAISGPAAEQTKVRLINTTLRALVGAGVGVDVAGVAIGLLSGLAYNEAIAQRSMPENSKTARTRWAKKFPADDVDMILAYRQTELFSTPSRREILERCLTLAIDRLMPELRAAPRRR